MEKDKLIAVHNGALGDFLCSWPALLALARGMRESASAGDTPRLLFAGAAERMRWLAPLGYRACTPQQRRALEGLYGPDGPDTLDEPDKLERPAHAAPPPLAGFHVAWFCLDRPPVPRTGFVTPLPCLPQTPEGSPLPDSPDGPDGPETGNPTHTAPIPAPLRPAAAVPEFSHVTDTLRAALARAALPGPPDWDMAWPETWRALFGGWEGADSRTVALVPGAGHRFKQWPPERFAALAAWLERRGYSVLYLLGPAELERGLDTDMLTAGVAGAAIATPADHGELADILRRARLVVGNDSGPLHLAALHGAPVLALFGPAPDTAWSPHGATVLRSPLPCAPCSPTLRTLGCQISSAMRGAAPCMAAITTEQAMSATGKLLGLNA